MGRIHGGPVCVLAAFALCHVAHALVKGPELLANHNPGLEVDSLDPAFKWDIHKYAEHETVTDAHTGQKSLKIFNRTGDYATAKLKLTNSVLLHGRTYFYSFYVKFLNHASGSSHFNVTLKMKLNKVGVNRDYVFTKIADLKFQRPELGWQQVGADFRMPTEAERNYQWGQIYMTAPAEVDFLFDTNTLYELIQPEPSQWLTDVNAKILQERTNAITITANIPPEYNTADLEIKVDQESRPFKFGGAIRANDFIDMTSNFSAAYRDYFYDNFDMAVAANAMKWKTMVWNQDVYKTDRVDTFLDMMDANGIAARAHTILFGKYNTQPHWLLDFQATPIIDPTVLRAEVAEWIETVCTYYQNRYTQWDVYNEYLHSRFYETILGDEDYLLEVYDLVAQHCTGDLYTNDYNIIRSGLNTLAQLNVVQWLLDEGKQVDGIGAQMHIKEHHFVETHVEMIEHRLELLCSLGLPVMITEMTIQHANVTVRAEKLDQLLRLFYSQPCVKSVVYWTFAEETNSDVNYGQADGLDVQPNAVGNVWHSLTRDEWKTSETILPSANQLSETFPGHHGDYSVTVNHNGNPIVTSSFTLTKGQVVTHDIVFP